jgi:hypothetical protein
MFYALMGYVHAAVERRVRRIRMLAGEAGQGTVEYVGLILLVSLLMVGMVAAMKGFNRQNSKTRNLSRLPDVSSPAVATRSRIAAPQVKLLHKPPDRLFEYLRFVQSEVPKRPRHPARRPDQEGRGAVQLLGLCQCFVGVKLRDPFPWHPVVFPAFPVEPGLS